MNYQKNITHKQPHKQKIFYAILFSFIEIQEKQTQLCDDKCQNEVKTGIDLEQKATDVLETLCMLIWEVTTLVYTDVKIKNHFIYNLRSFFMLCLNKKF